MTSVSYMCVFAREGYILGWTRFLSGTVALDHFPLSAAWVNTPFTRSYETYDYEPACRDDFC